MVIQAKKKPIIQKGEGYVYIPNDFDKHKVSTFKVVETAEELLSQVQPFVIQGSSFITFDTETHPYYKSSQECPKGHVRRWVGSGKNATPQDYPFCISICDGKNCYTLFDSIDNDFKKLRALAPLLEDPSIEKVAHNAKYDMHMLSNAGCKIVGKIHDTVILAKLLNENRKSFQLRDIASGLCDGITKFEYMVDRYKSSNKVHDYRQIPTELLTQYANADVWNCFLEFKAEYPKLEGEGMLDLYNNEMELMIVLYAMEFYGMQLDTDYEEPLKRELQQICDESEQSIYDEAGKMFNINSTKQLYDVLMELGVSSSLIGTTGKGNPCLDKKALNKLAEVHNVSIVRKILDFRKNDKLLNTYAIGIYDQRDAMNRVHGSVQQSEATTGRMSITKPALQTLPKKDKRIRSAFVPDKGYTLWFMDLDQVEYRLFAHYAKASTLLDAIANGYDVHAATAATIFHKDLQEFVQLIESGDEEASATREKGKTINFALIYGVGIVHLGELLQVSATEASTLRATYFTNLPEAHDFINSVQTVIKMRGYVKNFYGRRRRLTTDECYKAPNALIQGCAADYIKHKIVDMYKYIMFNNLKTRMINIVHDEIVMEVAEGEEEHLPVLRWLMSDFKSFRCPITAGAEYSLTDWGHKSESSIGFIEPIDKAYKDYDIFNGQVFDIRKTI